MSEARLDRRRSLGIFVVLFVSLAYFLPGASWSPVARFSLTRAIVERGQLDITPFADSTGDRALRADRYYSDKAPVPSLLAVPAYAAFHAVSRVRGHLPAYRAEGTARYPARRVTVSPAFRNGLYVCSLSTAGFAGALLGVALFRILRRRYDAWPACLGALTTVIATPLLPYGASFFGHTIGAAFLVGAALVLDPLAARPRRGSAALAGACLALAAGSEYVLTLASAIVLGFAWVTRPSDRRAWLPWVLAGALGPLLVIAGYHTLCFGAPWRLGYAFIVHPAFEAGQSQGLFGITYPRVGPALSLLFGSARGLFYLSPLCLVGVAAAIQSLRRGRAPMMLLSLVVLAALWVVNASYFQWDGGWATGPRHLVPAVALLGLGIGAAFADERFRTVAAVAAGVSATVLLLTVAVGLEAPPGGDAIRGYLIPAVREGRIARISGASNLGLLAGLSPRASLAPVFVWILLGGAGLAALCRPEDAPQPASQAPSR